MIIKELSKLYDVIDPQASIFIINSTLSKSSKLRSNQVTALSTLSNHSS